MELFSTTGFEVGDKVFVVLNDVKYFGVVVEIDDRLERVKVDFTSKSVSCTISWFHKSFWKKEQ